MYEDALVTVTTTEGDSFRATVHHPVWVINGRDLAERPTPPELNEHSDPLHYPPELAGSN